MAQLIIFTGLPGTGKSSLAEAVGQQLSIPVIAKDWLEATLKRCELRPKDELSPNLGYAAYELLTTLAEQQLKLGHTVILDSVVGIEPIRQQWRKLAETYEADWTVIECICSDETVHHQRLLRRKRGIPSWYELTWAEVARVKGYFVPWSEERLVIDSLNSLEENCQHVIEYLNRKP